jgi:endonuclease-8
MHMALAGRTITRFTSVFPTLTRLDEDTPLRGQTVDRVESRGKHLLIWFSNALVLRTHMRMHGAWHVYRPGERWHRPRHEMRIVVDTSGAQAVAFNVPVAEFLPADRVTQAAELIGLGPDPLSSDFDAAEAVARITARGDHEIADALIDQTAIAGIGNIFKSEVLFASRVNPFAKVRDLSHDAIERLVAIATRLLRANIAGTSREGIVTYGGLGGIGAGGSRSSRVWVYRRAGKPCRRCGTPISMRRQGPYARSTYWCERCQAQ